MNLRWTAAGRAALASAEHVGPAAVRLTHFAIGDGQGPGGAADDARAALRSERHRVQLSGTDSAAGQLAARADFMPDASYAVTEAGVFGTHGDPPSAAQLLLYWSDGGAEAGRAAAGADLVIAAVIDFSAAEADVEVTLAGSIVLGCRGGERRRGRARAHAEAAFRRYRQDHRQPARQRPGQRHEIRVAGSCGRQADCRRALAAGGQRHGTRHRRAGDDGRRRGRRG